MQMIMVEINHQKIVNNKILNQNNKTVQKNRNLRQIQKQIMKNQQQQHRLKRKVKQNASQIQLKNLQMMNDRILLKRYSFITIRNFMVNLRV
jgi:chemotaxis methyl-accepting protein methylase